MARNTVGMISEDGHLWIAVPIEPRASSTGKTTNLATTGGFSDVVGQDGNPLSYQGHAIKVSVNATIPVPSTPRNPQPAQPATTGINVPHGMAIPSSTLPNNGGAAVSAPILAARKGAQFPGSVKQV